MMNPAYRVLLKSGLDPRIRWEAVHRIHLCYGPIRRDKCAGVVMEEMEALIGRLAMVLFTEKKLERQRRILARGPVSVAGLQGRCCWQAWRG